MRMTGIILPSTSEAARRGGEELPASSALLTAMPSGVPWRIPSIPWANLPWRLEAGGKRLKIDLPVCNCSKDSTLAEDSAIE
jgi:hypothetical protein